VAGDDRPGGSISRRRLLASAGTVVAAGLAGCGSSGRTRTNPEFRAADADVLDGLLGLENRAIAAYAHAARLLAGPHQALVRRIGVQEAAHAYAVTGAIYRLGGVPTPGLATYAFTAGDGRSALALAAEVEDMSIALGIDILPKLSDLEARGTVVGIANNDAQHAVLIAQARGLPALPSAIVRGRA
jgi:hypothetical protein